MPFDGATWQVTPPLIPTQPKILPLLFMRLTLTWVMGWWAAILAWPGDTFATGPGYRMFSQIASEDAWATIFGIVCVIGALSIRYVRLRSFAAQILSVSHGVIALLIMMANPISTGTGVYAILAAMAGYLVIVDRRG